MQDNLFGIALSEKQFMHDVEKCKKIVDLGVKDYFVLYDNITSENTITINTTLRDIEDVLGENAISYFRVAEYCDFIKEENRESDNEQEVVFTMRVRKLSNGDRKKFRNSIRYFPDNTYVVEWVDATGFGFKIPFIQKDDCEIVFLSQLSTISKTRKTYSWEYSYPYHRLKEYISRIPDYFNSNAAVFRYKGVDCIIPLKKGTAKHTFKNREKVDGVKQRLIHDVKPHKRQNLKIADKVEHHIRGTSMITLNGIDIRLFATLDQAITVTRKEEKRK